MLKPRSDEVTDISNSPSGTHFGKSLFLDFFLTFSSIFLQKTNRELPNLDHALPKCVPEGLFEIFQRSNEDEFIKLRSNDALKGFLKLSST